MDDLVQKVLPQQSSAAAAAAAAGGGGGGGGGARAAAAAAVGGASTGALHAGQKRKSSGDQGCNGNSRQVRAKHADAQAGAATEALLREVLAELKQAQQHQEQMPEQVQQQLEQMQEQTQQQLQHMQDHTKQQLREMQEQTQQQLQEIQVLMQQVQGRTQGEQQQQPAVQQHLQQHREQLQAQQEQHQQQVKLLLQQYQQQTLQSLSLTELEPQSLVQAEAKLISLWRRFVTGRSVREDVLKLDKGMRQLQQMHPDSDEVVRFRVNYEVVGACFTPFTDDGEFEDEDVAALKDAFQRLLAELPQPAA
jgi:DNA repair exonuclease SbcCD ATPase subunit